MTLRKQPLKSSPSSAKPKRKRSPSRRVRQPRAAPLAKVKDDLSKYLGPAAQEQIVITRRGLQGLLKSVSNRKRLVRTIGSNTILISAPGCRDPALSGRGLGFAGRSFTVTAV